MFNSSVIKCTPIKYISYCIFTYVGYTQINIENIFGISALLPGPSPPE